MLDKALQFCKEAHNTQRRKYTEDPYWFHCFNVASNVKNFTNDQEVICAAYLHDVLEDTTVSYKMLELEFSKRVADLVVEVTDKYTKENYPQLNRKERKFLEACRLKEISQQAKLIKYFDMLDNTSTICQHDPGFAKTYLKEKQFVLSYSLSDLRF